MTKIPKKPKQPPARPPERIADYKKRKSRLAYWKSLVKEAFK